MIDKHIKPPQIILPPKPKKPEKFEVYLLAIFILITMTITNKTFIIS